MQFSQFVKTAPILQFILNDCFEFENILCFRKSKTDPFLL